MIQNHDRMEGHPKPGELKRKKAGQKKCNNCHKIWNNAATPNVCSCKAFLGGTYVAKVAKLGAVLITAFLASVRLNERGNNVRTFVHIGEEKKVIFLIFPIFQFFKISLFIAKHSQSSSIT